MIAAGDEQDKNVEISNQNFISISEDPKNEQNDDEEEELRRLLLPKVDELPQVPPSAVEANFTTFFAPDFMKPGHDQYVHRHANGLCVIGLAPHHVSFKEERGIVSVDFNVGKSDRSGIRVTGKRKRSAQHLCKVCTADGSYIHRRICRPLLIVSSYSHLNYSFRCCVKGSLLEVNERLIKQPELLNMTAEREGYVAVMMPKPADWLKAKASLLDSEGYRKLRMEQ